MLWCTTSPALAADLTARGLPCLAIDASCDVTIDTFLHAAVAVFTINPFESVGLSLSLLGCLAGAQQVQLSPVNNVAMVEGGGEIPARGPSAAERDAFNNNPAALPVCSATVDHNACRTPTPVQLAASVHAVPTSASTGWPIVRPTMC